ncbi:MAG: hypothetical protein QM725_11405 [Lacibacter sp.]
MERYMYQDESFERMLKQKADEYKMYPSVNIWENIQQRVQKKSYLFNLKSTSLTIILLTTFSLYISNNQQAYTKLSTEDVQQLLATTESTVPTSTVTSKKIQHTASLSPKHTAVNVISSDDNEQTVSVPADVVLNNLPQTNTNTPEQPATSGVIADTENENNNSVTSTDEAIAELVIEKTEPAATQTLLLPGISTVTPQQTIPTLPEAENTVTEPESATLKTDAELNYEVNIPVLLKPKLKKEIQYYITPSASYRILYAENLFTLGNLPQQNPDNAVTHKAALGFEAGAAVRFPVTSKFRFVAGVQLNYTRYTVNAYKSSPELTTVRLNYAGIQQRVSTLNNSNGFWPDDVANETYQVALPVGIQAQLAGNRKLQWNIGVEVQPTYIIKASGYLITNDYTKYIKAPDLLSRLNLNTSLQSLLSWNAKNYRIIAGPQLRYQLFSNNAPEYPIQEHLIDYGFRIGFIKTLR